MAMEVRVDDRNRDSVLLAVYRNRNITKAAEELIVTRPVVSRPW